jgi:hypothetical protein
MIIVLALIIFAREMDWPWQIPLRSLLIKIGLSSSSSLRALPGTLVYASGYLRP